MIRQSAQNPHLTIDDVKNLDQKQLTLLILGEVILRYTIIEKHQTREQLLPEIKKSMQVEYPLTTYMKLMEKEKLPYTLSELPSGKFRSKYFAMVFKSQHDLCLWCSQFKHKTQSLDAEVFYAKHKLTVIVFPVTNNGSSVRVRLYAKPLESARCINLKSRDYKSETSCEKLK